MLGCEVILMAASAKSYSFYPEKIARVVLEHDLIMPGEEHSFASFVRGC